MRRLSNLSLLRVHSAVLDELKRRDVLRTKNNPPRPAGGAQA
jgi:hypothetical protein